VLVNNAWGGHEFFAPSSFNAPLWEQPIVQWDAMFSNGVRNHIVTLQATGPLLRRSAGRLVAAITFWDDDRYLSGNVFYDLAKAAINRLAFAAAQELRADGIASVAISPGFMQTELVLANHTSSGKDTAAPAGSETPHYLGRAVVALASDPGVISVTGSVLRVGDLARRYGFTDLDGSQPPPFTLPTADSQ
jgi:NAD(P)-dependent dehydrogenase (short-subunit alcohol dehydrogenase family)